MSDDYTVRESEDPTSCSVCGFPLADHDPDPIGDGLTQYTCPEVEHA